MMKWMTFFVFVFVFSTIIASVIDGGGGISSTTLTADVSSNTTTIPVVSTIGFLDATPTNIAYLQLGNREVVSYTGSTSTSFTGVARGIPDPQTNNQVDAQSWSANTTRVKTLAVAALDTFMGYNITTSGATFGALDAITLGWNMLGNMPKFLMWDYSFLQGQWVMLRYLLFSLSIGFMVGLAMVMLQLARSIWL